MCKQSQLILAPYLKEFNKKVNGGKTKLLIFVKARRPRGFNEDIKSWNIFVDGVPVERVSTFKYLGITMNYLCDVDNHIALCKGKVKAVAVRIGKLCSQLHQTNLYQLRSYFCSFVVSQLFGRQVVSFPRDIYETGLMLFF